MNDQTTRLRAIAAVATYGATLPEGEVLPRDLMEMLVTEIATGGDAEALESAAAEAYRHGAFDPESRMHQGVAAEAVEALEALIGRGADDWRDA